MFPDEPLKFRYGFALKEENRETLFDPPCVFLDEIPDKFACPYIFPSYFVRVIKPYASSKARKSDSHINDYGLSNIEIIVICTTISNKITILVSGIIRANGTVLEFLITSFKSVNVYSSFY